MNPNFIFIKLRVSVLIKLMTKYIIIYVW